MPHVVLVASLDLGHNEFRVVQHVAAKHKEATILLCWYAQQNNQSEWSERSDEVQHSAWSLIVWLLSPHQLNAEKRVTPEEHVDQGEDHEPPQCRG